MLICLSSILMAVLTDALMAFRVSDEVTELGLRWFARYIRSQTAWPTSITELLWPGGIGQPRVALTRRRPRRWRCAVMRTASMVTKSTQREVVPFCRCRRACRSGTEIDSSCQRPDSDRSRDGIVPYGDGSRCGYIVQSLCSACCSHWLWKTRETA